MKFQKGSRVEVMNKTEVPTSWCVAQVVSGNRHTYNLKFDCSPGIEKVSWDLIRPCPPPPPPPPDLQTWAAGDIVEVFNDNSWKTATVCNVFLGGHYSLKPHGLTHEIIVQESNIRARLTWQHGEWLPIVAEPQKRASPFCSSYLKTSPANGKKLRAYEALGSARERISEPNNDFDNDQNDFENDQCSIGSCSIFSDAESFNTLRDVEEVAESVHRLEMRAYRSTLEALYAFGPLSWDKEALLTNLRINLHISNDEHLTELRNLISVETGTRN